MTLSPTVLLVLYCIAIAGFSLVGGLLPNWVKMTHTRTQVAMSLVSGLMLGVAFYHLLPHSIALLGGAGAIDTSVQWLMLGLITMLLLLRIFHFHQHDFRMLRCYRGAGGGDRLVIELYRTSYQPDRLATVAGFNLEQHVVGQRLLVLGNL